MLLFTDEIDEFMIQILNSYEDVPFKSVQQGEADFVDDTQKEDLKTKEKRKQRHLKST